MSKNDNKELNAILAQLKKSYSGNENIENTGSDESEDDFQKMLSNYFSYGDPDGDIYKFVASESPDPENITTESDYSLADFEYFSVEEEPTDETTVEEAAEEVTEEVTEEAVEEEVEEVTEEVIEQVIEEEFEEAFEEITENAPIIEETVEDEPVIEETFEDESVIEETVEDEPEFEETVEDEPAYEALDDNAIVDDVFAAMFPSSNSSRTAYEELGLESSDTLEPKSAHTEHISRMLDLQTSNEDYNDDKIIDLPKDSDDYDFVADDVVILDADESDMTAFPVIEDGTEDVEPVSEEISHDEVVYPKETIDDIISDMDFDDEDITLDISAMLQDTPLDDNNEQISDAPETDEDQIYFSDPLQGHLSDAAFVSYKISDDEVDFDIDVEQAELDDEEVSLLLDFGYDDEAEAEVGRERAYEIKRRKMAELSNDKIYGYCGEEYISKLQDTQIKERYAKDKKELLIKSAVVFAFCLVLFFMTLVNCFGASVNYLLYSIIELIILAVISIIGFSGLKKGIIGLFKLDPNYNSVPAICMAVTLVYNLFSIVYVLVMQGVVLGDILLPCGFAASSYIFAMILSEYFECLSEATAFEVITSAGELYTAEKLNKTKEEVNSFDKQLGRGIFGGEVLDNKAFEVRKTRIPSAYFLRVSQKQNRLGGSFYLLGVIFVAALIMGCVALIKEGSVATAAYSSMAIILMSMPISLSFAKLLPKLSASLVLKEKKSAIVGDSTVEEYSDVDSLIFDDECAIEIVKKIEIRPQMDSDIAGAMKITARAFKALGGPMSKVVSSKIIDEDCKKAPTISILSIRDNGIEFYMDSSIHMLIGDATFMSTYGIRVSSDRDVHISADSVKNKNVIYIAIDGVPRLGYIIHSKVSDTFYSLVTELEKNGVKVAVSSYDPTVNDYYFEQNKIPGSSVIATYKPERFYDRYGDSMADGGIFSNDDPKNIIHPLIELKRLERSKKLNKIISYAASMLGCAVSIIFVIFILLEKNVNHLNIATLIFIFLLQSISILSVVFNSLDFKRKRA